MAKFLDDDGLSYLWGKIKDAIPTVTWRPVMLQEGSSVANIRTSDDDGALTIVKGSNITFTDIGFNAGKFTINAIDTKPGTTTNVVPANPKNIESGGTWKNLEKMDLPVGHLCLVTVHAQYENNTTGYRSVGIGGVGGSATTPLGAHYQLTLPPPNGAASNLVLTVFFVPETGVDYYIITRHTMGSTKPCTYRYRFVPLN